MVQPSKEEFLDTLKGSGIPPLYEEIPFASPFEIYALFDSPESFLFESVKGPDKIARYSFIGVDPCLSVKVKNFKTEIISSGGKYYYTDNPLIILRKLAASYRQKSFDFLPPFQGGIAGILCYDFVQYLEKLPHTASDDLSLPDAHLFIFDKLIAFDHLLKKTHIIYCPGVTESIEGATPIDWQEKYDESRYQIGKIRRIIFGSKEYREPKPSSPDTKIEIKYEMMKNEYINIAERVKKYIAAGDVFQVNLSQRVSARINDRKPLDLYKILREINPSPFSGFFDFGEYQIVSSSPERLIRIKDGIIETRPIAGTRPRGKNGKEDEAMRSELLLNKKERAEHIMLIDLERNDLGRVSEYGSVRVDELMITEDYSHVIHIVSNITGKLAAGKDCFDAIKAVFPGGTITGVPKVRCMEIIDELEPVRRGPYTGSIGYIGFSGNMDLNIIIRTFVIKDGTAYAHAGAGLVADSNPEWEYFETLKKAEALIRTLKTV